MTPTIETTWIRLTDGLRQQLTAAEDQLSDLKARFDAVQAALDAYKARGLQAAQTVANILGNPALTPEQKDAAIRVILQDIQANERERQRIVILAKLAEAQAEADKFNT